MAQWASWLLLVLLVPPLCSQQGCRMQAVPVWVGQTVLPVVAVARSSVPNRVAPSAFQRLACDMRVCSC
jgi:hypothetical protein